MNIRACLFDLDGVIVDTAKYHFLAWKRLADEMGFEFTEAHNERLKGVSRMHSLEILLEIGGVDKTPEEKQILATRKNDWYVEDIKKLKPEEILPGVKTFLDELKAQGIKIALGSASKNAPIILEGLNLTHYFDVIIDGNKVSKAKPDPEVFEKGAKELDMKNNECVVFEDAQAGIEAAKNGGMACVAIGSTENLSGYDFIMSGFENVTFTDIINNLN